MHALSPATRTEPYQTREKPHILIVFSVMVVVGLSEEIAKTLAFLCGAYYSAAALKRDGVPERFRLSHRYLIDSRRGLMLLGFTVGFGFMVIENAGYLVGMAVDIRFNTDDLVGIYQQDEAGPSISQTGPRQAWYLRAVLVFYRVLLNLHPWLTALTAANVARLSMKEGVEYPQLTAKEFCACIGPAMAAHTLFDTGILISPSIVALILPFVFVGVLRHLVCQAWDEVPDAEGDQAMGEDAFLAGQGENAGEGAEGKEDKDGKAVEGASSGAGAPGDLGADAGQEASASTGASAEPEGDGKVAF